MTEPLALEMLAACVPDHETRILDLRIEDDLPAVLADFSPDLVGVTALTPEVYDAWEALRQVKVFSSDIFTLVGGHHATLIPKDFELDYVDAIALGEGEMPFTALVDALANGQTLANVPNLIWRCGDAFVRNETVATPVSMDSLPLPRRDLVERYRSEYFFLFDKPDTSVATGRGCPYRCNFCSVWKFHNGKTRQMCPQRVLQEVLAVDTDHITFVDDNFLMNYRRETEIADLLRAEGINKRYSMECRTDSIVRHPDLVAKWTEIGLYAVLLGLEGASDRILQDVNKKNSAKVNDEAIRILQDHGIIIWGAFMVSPDWTEDDFKDLRDYVTAKQITHTQFTVLTPLPGTDLYQQSYDKLLTDDYRCYDTMHSVLPTRLPRERFYELFADLYKQLDWRPYWDMVMEGKLSIENCKMGRAALEIMSKPEFYHENDPVLGQRQTREQLSANSPPSQVPSPANSPQQGQQLGPAQREAQTS